MSTVSDIPTSWMIILTDRFQKTPTWAVNCEWTVLQRTVDEGRNFLHCRLKLAVRFPYHFHYI